MWKVLLGGLSRLTSDLVTYLITNKKLPYVLREFFCSFFKGVRCAHPLPPDMT
jgi:hypothetical protein